MSLLGLALVVGAVALVLAALAALASSSPDGKTSALDESTMRAAGYYYCYVEPVGGANKFYPPYRDGGAESAHRLDLASDRLRSPERGGESWQAVLTAEEILLLKERGFSVTRHSGPFATAREAEQAIEDWWSNK